MTTWHLVVGDLHASIPLTTYPRPDGDELGPYLETVKPLHTHLGYSGSGGCYWLRTSGGYFDQLFGIMSAISHGHGRLEVTVSVPQPLNTRPRPDGD